VEEIPVITLSFTTILIWIFDPEDDQWSSRSFLSAFNNPYNYKYIVIMMHKDSLNFHRDIQCIDLLEQRICIHQMYTYCTYNLHRLAGLLVFHWPFLSLWPNFTFNVSPPNARRITIFAQKDFTTISGLDPQSTQPYCKDPLDP